MRNDKLYEEQEGFGLFVEIVLQNVGCRFDITLLGIYAASASARFMSRAASRTKYNLQLLQEALLIHYVIS